MTDPIIVHGIPGSPYVRKPLIVCEEKGAPYRLVPMAFGSGAQKSPEYLALNPSPACRPSSTATSSSTKPRRSAAISTGSSTARA